MATITIEQAGCREGLLTIGRLVIVRGPNLLYPSATHQIDLDILPLEELGPSTGLTFVDPTIEVELSPTVSGSIERWFVPMSSANQPNGQHPEYFDGFGWKSFLDTSPGVPSHASRVRLRRDSTSIDWDGTAAAPNGLSFSFGVTMKDLADSAVQIDTVTFLAQASARQVQAFSSSCRRLVAELAVGAPIPGFVPPAE